ncbi:MAG: Xaa-Pro peptidase family protein [Candidatus Altiarchaeota archaeon]
MELKSEFKLRLNRVRSRLNELGLDFFLVSTPKNVYYLTGKDTGSVLIGDGGATLWVRDIYYELYSRFYEMNLPFRVRKAGRDELVKHVRSLDCKEVGIEDMSVLRSRRLSRKFKRKLMAVDIMRECRAVKTDYEIRCIRKSSQIAVEGMADAARRIRRGVSEREAAASVEYKMRLLGSESAPFDEGMILAYGKNAADIHIRPTGRKIGDGLVVVDLGAKWRNYYSDMTRTVKVGRCTRMQLRLLEFVSNLEDEAIDYLEPGLTGGEAHEFVQTRIEREGYRFHHASGHGIGLDVHEAPDMGPESSETLKEGMVLTIEPGIYLPGRMGVRFEDTVLLKKDNAVRLTA